MMKAIRSKLLQQLILTSAIICSASMVAAQTIWPRHTILDGRFSVEFPSAPSHAEMPQGAPDLTMHRYDATLDGRSFSVLAAILPLRINVSDPRAFLENAAKVTAEKSAAKIIYDSKSWRPYKNTEALEVVGTRDGAGFRSISLLQGSQYLALVYQGPLASTGSDDVTRFFESLRIESAPGK